MKIVCLVTNDLSQDRRMDRICRSLAGAGHKVTLVGRLRPNSLPLTERPYQQIRLPIQQQNGKGFYAAYNWALWKFLKSENWDAINAVDLDTIVPAALVAKKTGAKLVYDAHEYFSETPEVVSRPIIKKIWEAVAAWGIPRADLCYTVGPKLAEVFTGRYGKVFGVVRNVPETSVSEALPPPPADSKKIILYQGMLNEGRGLETACGALRLLPSHYILWLVGSGDIEAQLKAQNQDLVEQGRLVFHGFVPGHELEKYTQKSWLGLNLLDAISPSYYYSLANKCFDYIQCGLPSIQMDFPEYLALQQQYNCFVLMDRLEEDRLAFKITKLGEDQATYDKLKSGCFRAATALNWAQEERALLALWEQLEVE